MILAQTSILITRPENQNTQLADLIRQQGGTPLLFPTLKISAAIPPLALVQQIADCQYALFVSANAAIHGAAYIQKYASPSLQIGAIGPGTAKMLQRYHVPIHFIPHGSFDSENLLALEALQHVHGKKIAIFKGNHSRNYLDAILQQRGAQVVPVICYHGDIPAPAISPSFLASQWQSNALPLMICTSPILLENLFHMLPQLHHFIEKTYLLGVSPRIISTAKALNLKHPPLIAANASDDAILETLMQWKKQHD